jgi:hypothetical protein
MVDFTSPNGGWASLRRAPGNGTVPRVVPNEESDALSKKADSSRKKPRFGMTNLRIFSNCTCMNDQACFRVLAHLCLPKPVCGSSSPDCCFCCRWRGSSRRWRSRLAVPGRVAVFENAVRGRLRTFMSRPGRQSRRPVAAARAAAPLLRFRIAQTSRRLQPLAQAIRRRGSRPWRTQRPTAKTGSSPTLFVALLVRASPNSVEIFINTLSLSSRLSGLQIFWTASGFSS